MRLNRFFTSRKHIGIGSSIKLEDSDISHIRKVLRLLPDDRILLFNNSKEFLAKLKIVSKDFITAEVIDIVKEFDNSNTLEVILFQALLKAGKFDLIIEKTTELGIDKFIPVECEFSQSKTVDALKKIERWKNIVLSASKQSGRIKIMEVLSPINLKNINDNFINLGIEKLIVFVSESNLRDTNVVKLKDLKLKDLSRVGVLVGSEGGFSSNEIEFLKTLDPLFVTMDNAILRSETASIFFSGVVKNILK